MRSTITLLACLVLAACGAPPGPSKLYPDGDWSPRGDPAGDPLPADPSPADATGDPAPGGDATSCPLGHACNPIPIPGFPYTDSRDTRTSTSSVIDSYDCAPATDESGPEFFYQLTLSEAGLLWAGTDDVPGDSVDIDVHLLTAPSGAACQSRHNISLGWYLEPGTYLLALDTWVSPTSGALPGAYTLTVSFFPTAGGPCAMTPGELTMYWTDCATGIDCRTAVDPLDGVTRGILTAPAFGPVVEEAHLVTVDDDFGGGWPATSTDGIAAHYATSQAASGFVATRGEPWAPAGEGGSEYGQGAIGSYLPVLADACYVNSYGRQRPASGTRLVVINPDNGRAVIAAGGYETGPGANDAIGGAVEEIHLYLGTTHRSRLVMGFAANQTASFGPIDCGW